MQLSYDTTAQGAAPVSHEAIGGAEPAQAKPRWDPKGRRNMIVIGGVVGVAVLMLMILFLGGKGKEDKKASVIVEARSDQPAVNGMLSETDRAALKTQENARIAAAVAGHQSAVGTAVEPGAAQPISAQPQTNAPLTQQGEVRLNQPQQPSQSNGGQAPAPSAPAGPDESKMKGLESQMTSMMAAWGMNAGEGGQRTLSTYVRDSRKGGNSPTGNQTNQEGGNRASGQRAANDLMIVKAYYAPYAAEMISGADSDTPGKVRARILSGPLAGAVAIGTTRRIGDQGFQADFTTASFNGQTIKITAYGMDGEAPGDIVRGEYDGRYMQRYVFPVVAEGVKAYAGARAQVGTQVIAIALPGAGAGAVTGAQQTPAPSAEQARNAMYSSGANQVSRALATGPQEGHVLLAPGKQIGIVFEESIYQSDLAGQPRQGGR